MQSITQPNSDKNTPASCVAPKKAAIEPGFRAATARSESGRDSAEIIAGVEVGVGFIPPYTNRGGMESNPVNTLVPAYQILTPPTPKITCIIDYLSFSFSLDAVVTARKVTLARKQEVSYSGKLAKPQLEPVGLDYQGQDVVILREKTTDEVEVIGLFDALAGMVSSLEYIRNDKGIFGYRQSLSLYRDGMHCGKIGWDGNGGTCLVSLSGTGTSGVDMASMYAFMVRLPSVKITRVDIAHDDLEGKIGVDGWLGHYEAGGFYVRGKSPSRRMIEDFGSGEGRTLYVARLANGKEACIYEKGKQLGDKDSPWVRVEGRLSSVDRIVPLDVLLKPHEYLAGMYPAFSFLAAFHERIEVVKKQAAIAYTEAVKHARLQVGKLLNVMRDIGRTNEEIIETLLRPGIPKRLQVPLIA